jgi:nucleoside diphosphate kinase
LTDTEDGVIARTTSNPRKRELFRDEVYLRETLASSCAVSPADPLAPWRGITAAILKPEMVVGRMLSPTLTFFEQHGFRVVASELLRVDRLMTRELWRYRFNIATTERLRVMDDLMGASASLYVLLEDVGGDAGTAAARLKSLQGPSAPHKRRPPELRYHLGVRSHLINYLHVPDELADVLREFAILFDPVARRRLLCTRLSAANRSRDARDKAEALTASHGEHDLSFTQAVARVESVVRAADTCGDDRKRHLLEWLDGVARGGSRDWIHLRDALDSAGVQVELWDRIVISAEVVDMSIPGREPLL